MPVNRILLIDPSPLSREGLESLLVRDGFKTTAAAPSTVEEINPDEMQDEMPEVVLVDPGSDIERLNEQIDKLRDILPRSKIVILSANQDIDFLNMCFMAAVDGFVSRHTSSRVMMQSLHLILANERVFPSRVVEMLLANGRPCKVDEEERPETAASDSGHEVPLSEREIEIMQCLVSGHSNKAIAGYLDVTEATVKVHLKSILRKIRVNNRTQAAIWGIRNGIAPYVARGRYPLATAQGRRS